MPNADSQGVASMFGTPSPVVLSSAAHAVYRRLRQFNVQELRLDELARLAGVSKHKARSALMELEEKGIATIEEEAG